MAEWVLTVTQLNEYVRKALAADPMLRGVRLKGEISNWKKHSSGHVYFSLKDMESRIACVMFRTAAMGLRVEPRDGMRVVLTGSAALYPRDGQYQFYVDALSADGVGELYLAFERLKARLSAEGLFDAGRKRPLPLLPRGVGIVTSETGAVIRDIAQIARRRHPGVPLYLYPARVQGEGAAETIVRGIEALNAFEAVDVLIVGRGGGSLEELWPFNEEIVARAIYRSKKPVVSAVGHEVDYTIADFVADLRAPTPSTAAELVVPQREELRAGVQGLTIEAAHQLRRRIDRLRRELSQKREALGRLHPQRVIERHRQAVLGAGKMLRLQVAHRIATDRQRLTALSAKLMALGPSAVLARGYAYVTDADGHLVSSVTRAAKNQTVCVRLQDGALVARIEGIEGGMQGGSQKEAGVDV